MNSEYLTTAIPLFKRLGNKDNEAVTLYTEKFGKVTLTIQSGQKIMSKLSAHMEPAGMTEILYVQGKFVKRLIAAKRIKHYKNIWKDYNKIIRWFYFTEILNQLVKNELADKQIYNLLKYVLEQLDILEYDDLIDLDFFISLMVYRFFVILGNQAFHNHCQKCDKEIKEGILNIYRGEIICESCWTQMSYLASKFIINEKTLEIFYTLTNKKELLIKVNNSNKESFNLVVKQILEIYLDYPMKVKLAL